MKKILFCMFILVNIFKVNVLADDNVKTIDYKFEKRFESVGVSNEHDFYFDINDTWEIENASANIIFDQSNLTIGEKSTITFSVNGVQIYSMWLNDKFKHDENLKIEINKKYLKYGKNKFTIATTRRISDLPCEDDMNKANWMNISENSYVSINYKDSLNELNIKNFKKIYVDQNDELNVYITQKDDKQVEVATNLITYIKKDFNNMKNASIRQYDANVLNNGENKIIISDMNSLPQELLKEISESEKLQVASSSIIKNIKYNNQNIMLIIGNDLMQAIKLLGNNNLVNQINDNKFILDENINANENIKYKNKYTLESLGYADSIMRGPFTKKSYYYFETDGSKSISEKTNFNLKFKHSKNIDFERSLVTIYLNDVPITSKKLSEENADNDSLSFNIPKEFLNHNSFNLQVEFDLAINGSYCDPRGSDTPWAFIDSSSSMNIEYDDLDVKNQYLLDFPYKFVKNGSFDKFKMVVPSYNDAYLDSIAKMAVYLGNYIISNNGEVKLSLSENVQHESTENLLIIGTPSNNKFIKTFNDDLEIRYNNDFSGFKYEEDKEANFTKEYFNDLTTFQQVNNNFIITSLNDENIHYSVNEMINGEKFISRDAQVLAINKNGDVKEFSFNKNDDDVNLNKKINLKENKEKIVVFTIFTVIVATSIIFILMNRKKRDKK